MPHSRRGLSAANAFLLLAQGTRREPAWLEGVARKKVLSNLEMEAEGRLRATVHVYSTSTHMQGETTQQQSIGPLPKFCGRALADSTHFRERSIPLAHEEP